TVAVSAATAAASTAAAATAVFTTTATTTASTAAASHAASAWGLDAWIAVAAAARRAVVVAPSYATGSLDVAFLVNHNL
ncbi:hypothetical protein HK405_016091, partial [Cladochytrium tenue]